MRRVRRKRALMKRILLFVALAGLALCVLPVGSSAQLSGVVLDFENVADGTYLGWPSPPYRYYGLQMTDPYGDLGCVVDYNGTGAHVVIDGGWGPCYDGWNNSIGANTYIRTETGKPFYFNSVEYGNLTGGQACCGFAFAIAAIGIDGSTWVAYRTFMPTTTGLTVTAADLNIANVPLAGMMIGGVSGNWLNARYYWDNLNVTLPNIFIGDADTGVRDRPGGLQLSIQQLISQKAATATSHDDFVGYVAELMNTLRKADVLTKDEATKIKISAAQSLIGY